MIEARSKPIFKLWLLSVAISDKGTPARWAITNSGVFANKYGPLWFASPIILSALPIIDEALPSLYIAASAMGLPLVSVITNVPLVAEIQSALGVNPSALHFVANSFNTLLTAAIQLAGSWVNRLSLPPVTGANFSLLDPDKLPSVSMATALTFSVAISMPINTSLLIRQQ